MEERLPPVVLEWLQNGKISLSHLPDNSLGSVKGNAAFLQDLCGLSIWELGQLLFPGSVSKSSQQTLTVKLLNRGTLEEVVRVPLVLGFNQSVVFTKELRQKTIAYVKAFADPRWEDSVFSYFHTCTKCGTAVLTAKAKFCSSCGNEF